MDLKVVLVSEEGARFVIVVEEDPSETVKEAVDELNYWVKRITGTTLPVVSLESWDGATPYIAVGSSSLTEENGWNAGTMEQEEARVFIEQDRIGLLGNDNAPYPEVTWKGTYYAVLELVRKQFGVRWIWPGESGEVFTPRIPLEIEAGSWTWAPDLQLIRLMRNGSYASVANQVEEYFGYISQKPEARTAMAKLIDEQGKWLNRQRMNRSSNLRFGHSFTDWWERYGNDHPDWFAKPPEGVRQLGGKGVKLNLSNPEVQDQVFENWRAAWEEDPIENKVLPIGPNDSRGFDTRPETRAWDAPEMARYSDKEIYNGSEPILSDRYLKFWNIIARRVQKVDPEVILTTYAYRNYRQPPLGDERVEDNIIIGYVGGEGYYPDESFIRDEWQEWASKGAKLTWRPNLLHCGHGTPYLFSKAIYEDFRFFLEHNLLGTDFDSMTGNWLGQGLLYYVLAEVHSRPEASYDELANEYFDAFGPASQAVKQYHELFERRTAEMPELMRKAELTPRLTWGGWWLAHMRMIPSFLSPEIVAQAETLLDEALAAVDGADSIYKTRVEFLRLGLEHSKLMAEAFRQIQLDDPTVERDYDGEEVRKILQPLWDFRWKASSNYLLPVLRCLWFEESRFGIWSTFRKQSSEALDERSHERELTSGWVFKADPGNVGTQEQWHGKNHEASDWTAIAIGKPWKEALADIGDTKIGWYRVTFDMPDEADTGERTFLTFESVDAETLVWINGELVCERGYPHQGNYDSWDEPFSVEVTNRVTHGARNVLVVRVESESANAGITGKVSLVTQG